VLGVLLSLASATTFGINNALVRKGVITGTATQAVAVSMPVGLAVFTLVALAFGQLGEVPRFSAFQLLMLACAGWAHFVFGRYCAYRALAAMGANLAMPVTQWSLLVSLVLAMIFLAEKLDLMKLLGIALVLAGPTLLAWRERMKRRSNAKPASISGFKPRLVEGYAFGILACFGWGSSPIFVRAGLEGPGQALAGGVVSYSAATLAVAFIALLPRARRNLSEISPHNLRWFSCTGVMTAIAQILLYLAMAVAPVIIVQPLLRFQIIAGTVAGWFLNRSHESFDTGVLGAIAVSMIGAVFLALDGPAVMQWMDAPPWLAAVFAWRWP
jgi:drug/metabolite transporter (DMT)-like permease